MCLVGHPGESVLSEREQRPSEGWYSLTYLKRLKLTTALKVNQRQQRVETSRPTINRMVPGPECWPWRC